jgi:serine/threonine protein kinase
VPAERWIADRYRVEAELGAGGSATVYLVRDTSTGQPAALKLLAQGGGQGDRLRAEARAMAALDHPHVVQVYEFGISEGREYLVMEFLERGSLADRLAMEGPLPPREAVEVMLQVLEALGAAHAAGMVHRDVKPGNVLVRGDGSVALCDFGIARVEDGGDTRTGAALGSVPFMAPEQRVDSRRAGPHADLYAAACCLYNLLTADTPVDLYLAQDSSPRWEPVPPPLRPILRRATRSEASLRYHDAAEMAEALSSVMPALDQLPAVRARAQLPPKGYAPTRGADEPSVEAERRERVLEVDAWRMAQPRAHPAGRTALWVGVTVTLVLTATFAWLGPLSERPPPAPLPGPQARSFEGVWVGAVDGHEARLELEPGLVGHVVVEIASHELRTKVRGRLEGASLVLVESEAAGPQTFRGALQASGRVLEGEVVREGGPPMPFALVRVDPH